MSYASLGDLINSMSAKEYQLFLADIQIAFLEISVSKSGVAKKILKKAAHRNTGKVKKAFFCISKLKEKRILQFVDDLIKIYSQPPEQERSLWTKP